MISPITVECSFHIKRHGRGRQEIRQGPAPTSAAATARIPRVARLMALAIHFDGLVRSGAIKDYAEIARLGHVSRARVTQIMNLLLLAPDIQEEILFLPSIEWGRESLHIRQLQPIAAVVDWRKQRRLWAQMRGKS